MIGVWMVTGCKQAKVAEVKPYQNILLYIKTVLKLHKTWQHWAKSIDHCDTKQTQQHIACLPSYLSMFGRYQHHLDGYESFSCPEQLFHFLILTMLRQLTKIVNAVWFTKSIQSNWDTSFHSLTASCLYREIDRYLDFADVSVLAKTANLIGRSRCWQNTVIFLMHPDNLRKKAQWSKSRQLSYSNASRCG